MNKKYLATRFAIVFVMIACSVFLPAAVSAKDEWIQVRSKNFFLIGNADEKDVRKVATKLEQFRETFRLHDLRHYAVSRLIEQGANVMLVSRIAGHAKPSVTLDVYAHLLEERIEEAAVRYDPLGRREVDGRAIMRP